MKTNQQNREDGAGRHYYTKELIIHSHIADVLSQDHPLANENVNCNQCKCMLHCANNECMQTWIETEFGNYCTDCFHFNNSLECLEENLAHNYSNQQNNEEVEKKLEYYTWDFGDIGKFIRIGSAKNIINDALQYTRQSAAKEAREEVIKTNVYFYDVLRKLSNSINNAGHEERRSKDIEFIEKEQQKIIDDFEEFLP